jgi:hypothetical protein
MVHCGRLGAWIFLKRQVLKNGSCQNDTDLSGFIEALGT